MTFNVGDRVVYTSGDHGTDPSSYDDPYWNEAWPECIEPVVGTVIAIEYNDELPFRVEWSNGGTNVYAGHDLTLYNLEVSVFEDSLEIPYLSELL